MVSFGEPLKHVITLRGPFKASRNLAIRDELYIGCSSARIRGDIWNVHTGGSACHTTHATPHTHTHTTDTTSHTISHGDTDRERRQRETRERQDERQEKGRQDEILIFLFFGRMLFFFVFLFVTGSGFGLQMQIWASLELFFLLQIHIWTFPELIL